MKQNKDTSTVVQNFYGPAGNVSPRDMREDSVLTPRLILTGLLVTAEKDALDNILARQAVDQIKELLGSPSFDLLTLDDIWPLLPENIRDAVKK
jgi:hypothetical protein